METSLRDQVASAAKVACVGAGTVGALTGMVPFLAAAAGLGVAAAAMDITASAARSKQRAVTPTAPSEPSAVNHYAI
jgi:hypothetical protein